MILIREEFRNLYRESKKTDRRWAAGPGFPTPVAPWFRGPYNRPMTKTDTDLAKLSFEDALAELEAIVRTLEQGKGKLDESVAAYERGAALKKHCEKKLAEAAARIEKIQLVGGEAKTAAFDPER